MGKAFDNTLNVQGKPNSFNLLIANFSKCFWIKSDPKKKTIEIKELKEGLSIVTDKDLKEKNDKKTNFYFRLFSSLKIPDPSNDDWHDWKKNLTNIDSNQLKNEEKICFINREQNYGTRSSSLIGIPNINKINSNIVFKSTHSFPTINNYVNVLI